MHISIEKTVFPMAAPFAITGHVFETSETLRVTLTGDGVSGRGEAVGAYYLGESPDSMAAQLESVAGSLNSDLSVERIQGLLPPGGARNALDCAFWDYRAKRSGRTIWELLSITPRQLSTVYTLGVAAPEVMAEQAVQAGRFHNLKIKLDANDPVARLEAIRAARPDAHLIVDANQAWSLAALQEYLPHARRLNIAMIEQPLPRGEDAELEAFESPVPLGADESCLHLGEFVTAAKRYDVINIKLDKCGGLTEGLALVEAAQRAGLGLMVGNMCGSSLSMAPSYVVGQFCQFIDIDGPLLLKHDVPHGLVYGDGGIVSPPEPQLWG
ncbi:dipeptide epimerase [Kineobactrum salinum]|uniref:Dipeptide epimerase n=1 Tax=Kineobactrum salinum TaxID=2708301 RepID=A0A6C0U2X5_9GAMM|nr:dipeptide epimerase [Kineobactrum salinum]QIB66183.1 dipeptide epimerase [Kineobactrum salinum]